MEVKRERLLYIDNIRLLIIALVVVQHLAVTYSGIGSWYYKESAALDLASRIGFNFFESLIQSFSMGLLFLIAGYFVPKAYDSKGFQKFINDRMVRLGIPALVYMLIINPLMLYFELGNFAGIYPDFWSYYASGYLGNLSVLGGSGPMWFVIVLLFFSAVYGVIPGKEPAGRKELHPTKKNIWLLVFIIAAFAFAIRLAAPAGTSYYNYLLGYFAQYIVLFIVGILAYRHNLFARISYKSGKRWLICGIAVGFASWLLLFSSAPENMDALNGGFTWQSAGFSLWESAVAVAMDIGLIAVFREKLNRQNKFVKTLSDSSFAVYVFHTPIVIGAALLFRPVDLPPAAKFAMMVVICLPLVFLAARYIVRKIPLLKKVM